MAINSFPTDTASELALVEELALEGRRGDASSCTAASREGGAGAVELANAVVDGVRQAEHVRLPHARRHADRAADRGDRDHACTAPTGVDSCRRREKDLARIEKLGLGHAPVCMAKTHLSLSHDPLLRNRPDRLQPAGARLVPSAGAGFVVALCGDMQRMPGLGKTPAFMNIDIDDEGRTVGLF